MSGLLSHSPAQIIRQLLLDLSLGNTSGNWTTYYSTLPESPDKAIAVFGTAGLHQGREMINGKVFERYGFQVMIRSSDYASGYSKANSIAISLDEDVNKTIVSVSGTRYRVHAISRDGSVIPVGKDETSRRLLFSVNANTYLRKTT